MLHRHVYARSLTLGANNVKQVWYADDAAAAGRLSAIHCCWDNIQSSCPYFGYHANTNKTRLICKEQYLSQMSELFRDSNVKINALCRPYLCAALGSEEYVTQFVRMKVTECQIELLQLAKVATTPLMLPLSMALSTNSHSSPGPPQSRILCYNPRWIL